MTYALSEGDREQYRREGYVILRGLIGAAEIEALKADIRDLVECAAAGNGPEMTWIDRERRLPERTGRLLRPETIRPAFVASLVTGPHLSLAEQILDAPVRYSLFGMLAGGGGKPYIQNWHRDLAPTQGDQQLPILERNYHLVTQVNAPLFTDRYLALVPGSHLRPVTAAEQEVLSGNPKGEMPGQMAVEVEPGDVAFYDPDLLHRGHNPDGALRWTMHHAFIVASQPVAVHERGQESWIAQPGYLASLPERLRVAMQRYLDALSEGDPPRLGVL